MAAKAIGGDKVIAVIMPCNSNIADMEDAQKVVKKFGVKSYNIDLSESFEVLKREIDINLGETNLSKEALINMKPRMRMMTLYSIAQTYGYLVIGTRKSFRKCGTVILQNGEIAGLILIQSQILLHMRF